MKFIRKTIRNIIIAANVIAAIAMITCAYASAIHPAEYPSCSYLGMLFPITAVINVAFIILWLFISKFWSLISIGTFIICLSPLKDYCPVNLIQSDPPSTSIKFLSYNVMGFGGHSNGWDDNQVVGYILDSGADIVCLQEAHTMDEATLKNVFGEKYPHIRKCLSNEASLAMMSTLPILDIEDIDFPGSSNHCCLFRLLSNDDTLSVYNTHLQSYNLTDNERSTYDEMLREAAGRTKYTDTLSNGEGWDQAFSTITDKLEKANVRRSTQADTLAQVVNSNQDKYIIVCGDFNDTPLSYTHRRLTENLNDAYTMAGTGPGVSYNRHHMYFRIDNILITPNITPYRAKVDNSVKESDHYPIFCYLELQ